VSRYVLDASAVLALLNGEPGAETVQAALDEGSVVGSVNLSEAVARLSDNGLSRAEIDLSLNSFQVEVRDFDREQAIEAGLMIAETKSAGLSLGDRACLALAKELGFAVLTGDRAWQRVSVGVQVELFR
jgi:PIN domain nuclease of toxin-antitoxin system